jgi:hypothetical protein
MTKSIIKKPENEFELKFMKLVNSHSSEYLEVFERYSEQNIDKIIEGADNVLIIQKFAVAKLNIENNTLNSNQKIRNKEEMVKEDKEKLVDDDNKEAYKLLTEEEI